jgi:integrase
MPRDPNHLTPETDGRFCKRVRGQLHHFGRNGDRDLALREWLAAKGDLLAGRKVHRVNGHSRQPTVTVKFLVDTFLTACTAKVNATPRPLMTGGTFDDYFRACDEFAGTVGRGRDPADLRPEDFATIRRQWGSRMGPWSLDRYVQGVRTMFNHAVTERLIDREPFYGSSFGKSSEAEKRASDRARVKERGERMFTKEELEAIYYAVAGPVRAMFLLALNGGMYAADVANVRLSDIQREEGQWVLDFSRNKTGEIPWKFPLWAVTVAAIEHWRKVRPVPRHPDDNDRLFITSHGRAWRREHVKRKGEIIGGSGTVDAVAQEFDKVIGNIWILEDRESWKWRPLKRAGVSFGALRHSHISAVGDHPDEAAAHRVTGHKPQGVRAKHYDKVPLHRLLAVTELARARLLPQ